ncbi:uncharacterized protein [Littorina saxatilis]|uniref:Uncharacterized protein n=1 Tax=Littorina saxatilis TaxID=31220 RepID=A0AAN9GPA3_9CAEN
MLPYYAIVVLVLIVLKLLFWSTYYCLRQRRVKRMAEAGLIRQAPTPGSCYPPIVTHGHAQGVYAQANYNTTYWTPNGTTGGTHSAATPPSYQEAVKSPSLPQEAPPPYIEKAS